MSYSARIFISFFLVLQVVIGRSQESGVHDYTHYVNPFIGTDGHGHTFPGATLPFGMMQLSPDTRLTGWDGCSGYHYSDEYIYGFSHTHLSGTGVSDYGDILLMPTDKVTFNNGEDGKEGYRSRFTHEKEAASPGFYEVFLESSGIKVELASSYRSGIHQYHFPSRDNQYVILDLEHRDRLLRHEIDVRDKNTISGLRFSSQWADDQRLFYYIELSHPIEEYIFSPVGESKGYKTATKVAVKLKNPRNEPVLVKVGISPVDVEGAAQNMRDEIGRATFAETKKAALEIWNDVLKKIEVKSDKESDMVEFYTAMYHVMIAPNLYQDIDGRHRGMDKAIYKSKDYEYYTVFSLWDTYRATHPLFTIIDQKRTVDFIKTFLAKYKEGGIIPIWDLSACYTGCMIGYHGVSIIADAYIKGIRDYDEKLALEAMIHSATRDHLGLKSYVEYGFIPIEDEAESVSKTLEYAYDDWAIAQMAAAMGKSDIYQTFMQRAQYYKNQFDPETGFMRGRFRNSWFSPFDPYEVNNNFTEANSWQYSFYVPQDVEGLISLYGGKEAFAKRLDALFSADTETTGRAQPDMTGLIGQYVHGNEPSHQIAYMYNYVNKPWRTQEYVKMITSELYSDRPEGIPGNEDCGQLSAWYIFSTLGFYPVTPGSDYYIIGTPHFKEAKINLENGGVFSIKAENVSDKNLYIQSARLNGMDYPYSYISHADIIKGGEMVFTMTDHPTDWGSLDDVIARSSIDKNHIVPVPYIESGDLVFDEKTVLYLNTLDSLSTIYYSLQRDSFQRYNSPIEINKSSELTIFAERQGEKSASFTTLITAMNPIISIQLESDYEGQYSGGGENALINGFYGTLDYRTGAWQGYLGKDLIATVKLKEKRYVDSLSMGFLQDQRSWIFLPRTITIFLSYDGENYEYFSKTQISNAEEDTEKRIERVVIPIGEEIKAVKIKAQTVGAIPEWHIGSEENGKAWIFADQINLYER